MTRIATLMILLSFAARSFAATLLREDTAVTINVGTAVDNIDGVTPETGLTAAGVDEIGVYKHEATTLTDISGTTTLTHRAGGRYTAILSASDTGTPGPLTFVLRDDSVCLPIKQSFMVLPANVYDSLVEGSDKLEIDLTQWLGVAPLALAVQRVQTLPDLVRIDPRWAGVKNAGDTINFKFTSYYRNTPTTLTGTPGVRIYKTGSTAESGVGVTLTVDYDGREGLNDVTVDTSDAFYVPGNTYVALMTDGDISGKAVAGMVCGSFRLDSELSDILADTGTDGVLLAADSITSTAIQDNAITDAKIAAGAITASEIADDAIDAAAIATDAIGADEISADAFGASEVAADAVIELQTGLSTFDAVNDPVIVGALSQAGLTDFFDTDSGTTYSSAVAGSVVKELAGGSADEALNELLAEHTTPGSLSETVSDVFDFLDGAPTFADAMDGHGYTTARAKKIDQLAPSLLVSTTIDGTPASQTSLTLTDGPPDDDALNGALIVVTGSDPSQKAVGVVKSYVESTKTVTLLFDPGIFDMDDGDAVDVIATGAALPLLLGDSS